MRLFAGQRERSPDYKKLRRRITHIWGNRRGQPNHSAMVRPPWGKRLLDHGNPYGRQVCRENIQRPTSVLINMGNIRKMSNKDDKINLFNA